MQNGYIKISRDITKHWLWHDSERLKWWLDLLLLANWEDREWFDDAHRFTLKRGQIVASVAFLMKRWGRSKAMILPFLKQLEDEYMIKREVKYRQTPIITICNYGKYQSKEDAQAYTQTDIITNTQEDTQTYTKRRNKEINNIFSNENNNVRKSEKTENSELEEQFEVFRKAYPGRKRGHDTEIDAFKRKHKNWTQIVPLLMPALERLIAYNNAAEAAGQWKPNYANLSTWLFQARWEEELPEVATMQQKSEEPAKKHVVDYGADDDAAFISKNR